MRRLGDTHEKRSHYFLEQSDNLLYILCRTLFPQVKNESNPSPTVTNMNQTTIDARRFDIAKIAASLPETATTLLVDRYLTNREEASARVFRVYKPTPPHYHATCDEYLYVFSGRGTFWMEDESTTAEFGPGELLFFKRGTVHAQPKILEEPVVFLAIDTPRRDPKDVVFVNPEDGTPESFIRADQ
jgi:mannose-6-phosphate isomerase-like protein (cupin superfamily)